MTLTSPAIWFASHQDDETLIMGAHIKQHVEVGRRNIVVLLTDGAASGVSRLYPDRDTFVKERDREFVEACEQLGAEPQIRADRVLDGTLTIAHALSVMEQYASQFPNASFKTMSPTDYHPDHATLGEALKRLNVADKRFYIRPEHFATVDGSYTAYYDIKDALLAYTPVGWLSSRQLFESQFVQARNKFHK